MASSLEAIGEGDRLLSFFQLLEPIEYFLIGEVVKVEVNFAFDDRDVLRFVLVNLELLNLEVILHQENFMVSIAPDFLHATSKCWYLRASNIL